MAEWRRTTVGDVITLQRGFDITRAKQRPGTVPVVSSGGIGSYHDTAMAAGPGVVMGRKGTLGKVFYLDSDYWPHDTTLWVKDFKGNNPRFVYYFLQTLDFLSMNVGSSNPTLNRNHVHPVRISWPDMAEQKRIAELLGALDDKTAVNERIARTSGALAITRGKAMVAGADGPQVSLADEVVVVKGNSYRSADLGGGDNWLVSLKCVGRDGVFRHAGLKRFSGEFKEAQVLADGDVVVAHTDLTQKAEVIARPVRVTGLGVTGRLVASLDLAVVRPKESLTREYLLALLSTSAFRDHAMGYCNGTTVLHLSVKALPAYRFARPERTTVDALTRWMAPLLALSDQARAESLALTALRDTLLPRLISGRLRVRDAEEIVSDAV